MEAFIEAITCLVMRGDATEIEQLARRLAPYRIEAFQSDGLTGPKLQQVLIFEQRYHKVLGP